jgi:hypothetical protein
VKVMALFVPLMKTVAMNLNRNSDVEASEAERLFGFTYIPRDEALRYRGVTTATPFETAASARRSS